ncbi:hypothetical protein GOM49_04885 [Clostridium bovifaecis]|uniref:Uncharacterized protein n=1 Tax=Clostridium bovifaecis TaxID=2184719 RepID=A0A6I6ELI8_9CLOT|nr:hypothetical protein GOM49_04885 [Clostridium bovifaecis]
MWWFWIRLVKGGISIAASNPEKIDEEKIKSCLPVGSKRVKTLLGGLKASGLYFPWFGDTRMTVLKLQ